MKPIKCLNKNELVPGIYLTISANEAQVVKIFKKGNTLWCETNEDIVKLDCVQVSDIFIPRAVIIDTNCGFNSKTN